MTHLTQQMILRTSLLASLVAILMRPGHAQTPRKLTIPIGRGGQVYQIMFTPKGDMLAGLVASKGKGYVLFWDLAMGKEQGRYSFGDMKFGSLLALSADGKFLAVNRLTGTGKNGHATGKAEVWDIAQRQLKVQFDLAEGETGQGFFTNDGKTLIVTSYLGVAALFDVTTGKRVASLSGTHAKTKYLALSPDGKRLVAGHEPYFISVWDLARRKEIHTFEHPRLERTGNRMVAFALSPKGDRIVTALNDNNLILWDRATGKDLKIFSGKKHGRPNFNFLTFGHDAKTIIGTCPGWTHGMLIWNPESGGVAGRPEELDDKTPSTHHANCAISPDRKLLATFGNRQIRFYDLPDADAVNKAPKPKK